MLDALTRDSSGVVLCLGAVLAAPSVGGYGLKITENLHFPFFFWGKDCTALWGDMPTYSLCRSVFKKDCYCIPPKSNQKGQIWWYAIAVFFKNASTSRALE